jgi:hypothetical protein
MYDKIQETRMKPVQFKLQGLWEMDIARELLSGWEMVRESIPCTFANIRHREDQNIISRVLRFCKCT